MLQSNNMPRLPIRVAIVDDHEVVRSGIRLLLANTEIEIVAEATDGHQAIACVRALRPDVVLLDIKMSHMNGLEALDVIRADVPSSKVIIMSTYDNPTYYARALKLGACGWLAKGAAATDLLEAIRAAAQGLPVKGPMEQAAGVIRSSAAEERLSVPLTNRETMLLRHVALGLSNREIATMLKINLETVKEHMQQVLRKLGVTDRTQAAVWAVKNGLM